MKIGRYFKDKDILSLHQFDPLSLQILYKKTELIKKQIQHGKSVRQSLKGSVIALLFFEPSTRTYNSFSSAVQRLGGGVIGIQDATLTSISKGESFEDTIRIMSGYSDGIVIRHPKSGSAHSAAELTLLPVINAGDGSNEHPTQTCMDLFTIYEKCQRLDGLTIVMGADPLHSRAIHSLARGLALYKKNTIYFISPPHLRISADLRNELQEKGIKVFEIQDTKDIPNDAQIWYWNRLQRERYKNANDYKKSLGKFAITSKLLKAHGNKNLFILDPLPRVEEILPEVDTDPRAYYFHQARNGLYVRMALLSLLFDKSNT